MWGSLTALKDAAASAVNDASSYVGPVLQEALGDVVDDAPRKEAEVDGLEDPTILEVSRRCSPVVHAWWWWW